MKLTHTLLMTLIILSIFPNKIFGQAPDLGTSSAFALFTANGAFGNTAVTTNVSGNIGTNVGAFTGFPPGTVTGQIHVADAVSAQAATDVIATYDMLFALTCDSVIGTTLGSGQTLKPFIYCMGAISVLNGNLTLDGQGNPDAIFIFKIDGAFSTSKHSNVILINSASLCNVYWQVNGTFDQGDSSVFRGTLIANGAISLLEGSSLIGRGLSKAGAIALNNNIVSNGMPVASVISADGAITFFTGDSVVLSGNSGGTWSNTETTSSVTIKTSGDYFVTNTDCCDSINSNHIIVSVSLPVVLLSFDATPSGMNVQLNWSTASEINNDYYTVMRSADGITFEDVLTINGAGNSNSLLYYSVVDYNSYKGTSYYRLLQTDYDGEYKYSNIVAVVVENVFDFSIYPNPFNSIIIIKTNGSSVDNIFGLKFYNTKGTEVLSTKLTQNTTIIETNFLSSGIYIYKIMDNGTVIQSGYLTSVR